MERRRNLSGCVCIAVMVTGTVSCVGFLALAVGESTARAGRQAAGVDDLSGANAVGVFELWHLGCAALAFTVVALATMTLATRHAMWRSLTIVVLAAAALWALPMIFFGGIDLMDRHEYPLERFDPAWYDPLLFAVGVLDGMAYVAAILLLFPVGRRRSPPANQRGVPTAARPSATVPLPTMWNSPGG